MVPRHAGELSDLTAVRIHDDDGDGSSAVAAASAGRDDAWAPTLPRLAVSRAAGVAKGDEVHVAEARLVTAAIDGRAGPPPGQRGASDRSEDVAARRSRRRLVELAIRLETLDARWQSMLSTADTDLLECVQENDARRGDAAEDHRVPATCVRSSRGATLGRTRRQRRGGSRRNCRTPPSVNAACAAIGGSTSRTICRVGMRPIAPAPSGSCRRVRSGPRVGGCSTHARSRGLAPPPGFEPGTFRLEGGCSVH